MRLLLDENVHRGAAEALRALGLDAVHASDVELSGRPDAEVLEAAIAAERVVVTRDYRDFTHLAQALLRIRRSFPGVLFLSPAIPQADLGGIARAIGRYVERHPDPPGTIDWVSD